MIIEKHKRNINRIMNGSRADVVKSGSYSACIIEVVMQIGHSDTLIFVFKIWIDDEQYYLSEKFSLICEEEKKFYEFLDLHPDEKGISFRDILGYGGDLKIETVEENGVQKSKITSLFLWESVSFDQDYDDCDDDEYDEIRG